MQKYHTLKPKTNVSVSGVVLTFSPSMGKLSKTDLALNGPFSDLLSVLFYELKEFGLVGSTSHHCTEFIVVDSSIL